MKVGIGCLSFNRPLHIQYWAKQVSELTEDDAIVHIASDNKERKGVSFRSNECLRELYNAGCEYIFLFNDDCFPIKKGYTDFFIEALQASGQNHFCYLKETPGVKCLDTRRYHFPQTDEQMKDVLRGLIAGPYAVINRYDNCNGCLMVMTRKAVETVGGFNPNYGIYGYEHADYSNRIHQAGLNPMGAYLCPFGASEYIYSCDLDNTRPEIQKKLKHKSSMSAREALHHVSKGQEIYKQPSQIHFPL